MYGKEISTEGLMALQSFWCPSNVVIFLWAWEAFGLGNMLFEITKRTWQAPLTWFWLLRNTAWLSRLPWNLSVWQISLAYWKGPACFSGIDDIRDKVSTDVGIVILSLLDFKHIMYICSTLFFPGLTWWVPASATYLQGIRSEKFLATKPPEVTQGTPHMQGT